MSDSASKKPTGQYGHAKKLVTPVTPDELGEDLRSRISEVLRSVPGCSLRPTDLARTLDVSRVMVSRVLSSVAKESPTETLTSIPGPETLRSILRSAVNEGVLPETVELAMVSVDAFDTLIREDFGTRAALNAALSVEHEGSRERFEQSSRYQVYKGMSQIFGVESKVWLTCSINTPNAENDAKLDISTVLGASGLRKLRPDTPILLPMKDMPSHWRRNFPGRKEFDISQYCQHPPAPITPIEANGKIINTFTPETCSKKSVYDLISATYSPAAQDRNLDPEITRRGVSVTPMMPVASLITDFIVHEDIYPGQTPELFVYNTNGSGSVHVLDPNWKINRLATTDTVECLGTGLVNLDIPDVPGYTDMVRHVCAQTGYEPDVLRAYRVHVQYPVYGTQYMLAFKLCEQDD